MVAEETPQIPAVERNIAAIHRVRKSKEKSRRHGEVFVDAVTHLAGTSLSLYGHLLFYGVWILLHFVGGETIGRAPSIETISSVASIEAILLAVFVLINQKRMNCLERKNSDLHLQMSLLAEHEVTRLAQMTDLIAKHLGVNIAAVEGLETVKTDINPDDVLERISDHERS